MLEVTEIFDDLKVKSRAESLVNYKLHNFESVSSGGVVLVHCECYEHDNSVNGNAACCGSRTNQKTC